MHQSDRDDILTVFLAEAEEIVQRLFVQLEELHFGYDGQRILDDIHRGFHTLYGAAALMELEPLTECTQLADKLMERLRTRRLSLSPSLMSLIVGLTSAVEAMLARLAERQPLYPIPEDLRLRLQRAAGLEPSCGAGSPLSESAQLDSQRLDQFFATGNWESGSASRAGDPAQSLAAGGEGVIARLLAEAQRAPTPAPEANRFVELADAELALAPPQVQNRLQQLETLALAGQSEQAAGSAIAQLIEELGWVRRRLRSVLADADPQAVEKSLLHLQLITEDMQSWLQGESESS